MSELPEGWSKAELPLVCVKITDGTHHSPVNHSAGAFKYITAKNIRRSGLDLADLTYVDAETHHAIYARCPVEKGDVLYIKDGATTGLAIVNPLAEPFSLLSSVALIKPNRQALNGNYLKHWLNAPDTLEAMLSQMTGTAIRRLTLTTISSQKIPLPPLPEQRRIVAKIDSLSSKSKSAREHLDHIPRLVEKYKQAVLAAVYESAIQSAPASVSLGEFAIEVRNGLSKKPSEDPSGLPILRISAVRPMRVRLDDIRHYPPNEVVSESSLLRNGDLLFTRYNGNPEFTAVCGMVAGLTRKTTYPDKLIRVRLNEGVEPRFVELMSASPQARQWLEMSIKSAAGQHGISGSDLKRMPLPIPNLAEQCRLVTYVARGFTWIDRLAAEATSARKLIDRLDQAVLAKAFRGELVPQHPDDEPASVLLEQIRMERETAPAVKPRRARAKRS